MFVLFRIAANGSSLKKTKNNNNTWTEHPVFMKSKALRPEGRGLCQQCHVVLWKTHMAWQGWGWAFSWQMGPCRILQSVVPPYGGPPAPDRQENSCSSCLHPHHLRLPAMVPNNLPKARASLSPTQMTAMFCDRMTSLLVSQY